MSYCFRSKYVDRADPISFVYKPMHTGYFTETLLSQNLPEAYENTSYEAALYTCCMAGVRLLAVPVELEGEELLYPSTDGVSEL